MIEKKEGLINEVIYNNTVYNNNQYRYYPTITGLNYLIDKLIELNSFSMYIKFSPFYVNSKIDRQIEFDDYMFYMECRDYFTEEELKEHLTRCMDHIYDIPHEIEQYDDMSEEKKRMANILYPLCKSGDYESYNKHLKDYKEYLDELILTMFNKVKELMRLKEEDLAFGYFCFEVHSE